MSDQLPLFESHQVAAVEVAVTGKASAEYLSTLHLGDETALLVIGTVMKVAHNLDDHGVVTRVQTVKVVQVRPYDAGVVERAVRDAE